MKKVSLNIEIGRKELVVLVGVLVLFLGVGFSVAWGGTNPSVMGHSAGELIVNVDGVEKPLQEAIDAGDLGSGSESSSEKGVLAGGYCNGPSTTYTWGDVSCNAYGILTCGVGTKYFIGKFDAGGYNDGMDYHADMKDVYLCIIE